MCEFDVRIEQALSGVGGLFELLLSTVVAGSNVLAAVGRRSNRRVLSQLGFIG